MPRSIPISRPTGTPNIFHDDAVPTARRPARNVELNDDERIHLRDDYRGFRRSRSIASFRLTAELACGIATFDTLLVTPTLGRPFDENYFGSWCAETIDQAGLPADCVWHGLRKAAARKLAELGLSEETIKSITGHISSPMVAKYVKDANQRKLAKAAMKAWENAE